MESLWRKSESCSASLMHQIFGFFAEEFLEHVPAQEEAPGGGVVHLSHFALFRRNSVVVVVV